LLAECVAAQRLLMVMNVSRAKGQAFMMAGYLSPMMNSVQILNKKDLRMIQWKKAKIIKFAKIIDVDKHKFSAKFVF
jgi:hypothetical protein